MLAGGTRFEPKSPRATARVLSQASVTRGSPFCAIRLGAGGGVAGSQRSLLCSLIRFFDGRLVTRGGGGEGGGETGEGGGGGLLGGGGPDIRAQRQRVFGEHDRQGGGQWGGSLRGGGGPDREPTTLSSSSWRPSAASTVRCRILLLSTTRTQYFPRFTAIMIFIVPHRDGDVAATALSASAWLAVGAPRLVIFGLALTMDDCRHVSYNPLRSKTKSLLLCVRVPRYLIVRSCSRRGRAGLE